MWPANGYRSMAIAKKREPTKGFQLFEDMPLQRGSRCFVFHLSREALIRMLIRKQASGSNGGNCLRLPLCVIFRFLSPFPSTPRGDIL
jgi:hypothetical protein